MGDRLFSDAERSIIKPDYTEPDYNSPENLSKRRIERISGAVHQLIDDSQLAEPTDLKKLSNEMDEFALGQLQDFIDKIRAVRNN